MKRLVSAALTLASLCACGGKKSEEPKKKEDAATGPQVAPLTMPVSGVDKIARMNFVYGDGWPVYDKAIAAKVKKDWAAVRTLAESSIGKDPYHLDAHRLLAAALSQAGEHAAVVDHLVTVLADDYFRYGPTLATDEDLKEFIATPHGQSVLVLAQKIHDDYAKRIASGVWLVGRRSTFKWPKDMGVQPATTRGELYAYDRETRRYFRLTHTDHRVAGFARAAGTEVAIVGFDKVDRPKTPPDAPPTFDRAWVLVLDTVEWKALGPKIQLGAAKEIELGYADGDQLLVSVDGNVSSVDKTSSKLTKLAGATLPASRIALTLEEGRVVRPLAGIEATWAGTPPTTTKLAATGGAPIQIPESGAAAAASLALAPGGAHLAFATAVDPCAKDAAPSLYVADAKKGTVKHLLTAKSRFPTRWIDATTLAYEDGEGAIRLWDATSGREAQKLDNKVGIALDVLSLAAAPLCRAAPPAVEAGSGSADEPLPLEEGSGSAAPVTAPQ